MLRWAKNFRKTYISRNMSLNITLSCWTKYDIFINSYIYCFIMKYYISVKLDCTGNNIILIYFWSSIKRKIITQGINKLKHSPEHSPVFIKPKQSVYKHPHCERYPPFWLGLKLFNSAIDDPDGCYSFNEISGFSLLKKTFSWTRPAKQKLNILY